MKATILLAGATIVVIVFIGLIVFLKRHPRKINTDACTERWHSLQKHCADRKTWHMAVREADRLLDDVLKRRHYKGKTTGERLVSAQHDFSNNESLWFGHKLYNRIVQEDLTKLSKQDTLEALSGFRQALKDLGALREKVVVPATVEVENPVIEQEISR